MFCNTCECFGPYFIAIVKSEDIIGMIWTGEDFVRSGNTFYRPADSLKSGQNFLGLRRRPLAHTLMGNLSARFSEDRARSSARTSASSRRTRMAAVSLVSPYAITPGI